MSVIFIFEVRLQTMILRDKGVDSMDWFGCVWLPPNFFNAVEELTEPVDF